MCCIFCLLLFVLGNYHGSSLKLHPKVTLIKKQADLRPKNRNNRVLQRSLINLSNQEKAVDMKSAEFMEIKSNTCMHCHQMNQIKFKGEKKTGPRNE